MHYFWASLIEGLRKLSKERESQMKWSRKRLPLRIIWTFLWSYGYSSSFVLSIMWQWTPFLVLQCMYYDFSHNFSSLCMWTNVLIVSNISQCRKFFRDKYGLSSSDANFVSSLVYFISVAGCPIVGFLVDKIGFNLIWCKSNHIWFLLYMHATIIILIACVQYILNFQGYSLKCYHVVH